MSNLLRAEGVSYQVNGRSILSDIDLSFETGSNTTIVGPSAGKVHFKNFIFIIKSYRRRNFYQEAPLLQCQSKHTAKRFLLFSAANFIW